MTVQELIEELQALPGDLSILPVQILEVARTRHGYRDSTEYEIKAIVRAPMAIYLEKGE